jgi:hypothetical protein
MTVKTEGFETSFSSFGFGSVFCKARNTLRVAYESVLYRGRGEVPEDGIEIGGIGGKEELFA